MSLLRLYRRNLRSPSPAWGISPGPGGPPATQDAAWRCAQEIVAGSAGAGNGERDAFAWLQFFREADGGQWDLRVSREGKVLFEVQPAPKGEGRPKPAAVVPFRLSRFAYLRRLEETVLLACPLADSRVLVHNAALLPSLFSPSPGGRGEATEAESVFQQTLVAAGFQATADEWPGAGSHPLGFWEFHDLVALDAGYPGPLSGPVGGTYRFRGLREPLPLVRPSGGGRKIPLPEPDEQAGIRLRTPLVEVLEKRTSLRNYAGTSISLQDLGALLHAAARVRSSACSAEKGPVSHRAAPSGGGLHALDVFPLVRLCDGLPAGLYGYDPQAHELEVIPADGQALERLAGWAGIGNEDSGFDPVPVLLLFAARFGRTAWKYEGLAYRLVQADLGCLEQTLYLTAAALGLAACALGGAHPRLFESVTGLSRLEQPLLGGLALGRAR